MTTTLDRSLTASKARVDVNVKQLLTGILREAIITVFSKYWYRVDFGPEVQPQYHTVSYEMVCACTLGDDCPAVTAVKKHLKEGGPPAEAPVPGYYPAVPARCPVCGAACRYDPGKTSKQRGVGWECTKDRHYWRAMGDALKVNFEAKEKAREAKGLKPFAFATFDNNPYAFKDGYDPHREYPSRCPYQ